MSVAMAIPGFQFGQLACTASLNLGEQMNRGHVRGVRKQVLSINRSEQRGQRRILLCTALISRAGLRGSRNSAEGVDPGAPGPEGAKAGAVQAGLLTQQREQASMACRREVNRREDRRLHLPVRRLRPPHKPKVRGSTMSLLHVDQRFAESCVCMGPRRAGSLASLW